MCMTCVLREPFLVLFSLPNQMTIKRAASRHLSRECEDKFTKRKVYSKDLSQTSVRPDMISFASFTILHLLAISSTATKLPVSSRDSFGQWSSCSSSAGMCIDVDEHSCSGPVVTGECPGGSNILCCRATYGIFSDSCASSYNGLCKLETDCSGTSVSGLCPGPSAIRCCPSSAVPTNPAGDVPVTPGIYLQLNPPTMTQFRGRKSSVRPVIVVHTAESGGTAGPPDSRAEGTAHSIQTRTTYGAYHLIGDTDSIIQLVSFNEAAFHDRTGSNEWSIGISLAMQAASWPSLPWEERAQLVSVAAQMAAMAAEWFDSQGVGKPAAIVLSREQSEASTASGFISHGARDPTRRTDPGADFPWAEFLVAYSSRT